MDASGVVERTGANVTEFRRGDRVITWSAADGKTWGSYAEFMRVPARNVSPMPKSLDFVQAATVPVAALTAFPSLFHPDKGSIIPGQRVLIHGAAGGVGSFAVQFAERRIAGSSDLRYRQCGVCQKSRRRSCHKTEDVCQAVRDWSVEGVDVSLTW
jgi:NADPH:quinone reductase-like Zn-dependent oxidoreductase